MHYEICSHPSPPVIDCILTQCVIELSTPFLQSQLVCEGEKAGATEEKDILSIVSQHLQVSE